MREDLGSHRGHRESAESVKAMASRSGDATSLRAGTRWQLNPDTIVSVEATRQASAGEADNQLMLRAGLRF